MNQPERLGSNSPEPRPPALRQWRWFGQPGSNRKVARDEMDALVPHGRMALAEAIKRFQCGRERPWEVRKLADGLGLWEIRARVGREQFRAVYFHDSDVVCVCVTAVFKNQRHLPRTDRERAVARMRAWQAEGRKRRAVS